MKDTTVIAIVAGVVVIVLVVVLGPALKTLKARFLGGSIEADTHVPEAGPPRGAHQTGVVAGGNARARDGSGYSATQENVRAYGDAEAIVEAPPPLPPAPGGAGGSGGGASQRPNG